MEKEINLLQQSRNNILAQIDDLSISQLNKVPSGFNNNIVWNVGHLVVTQQILHYKFAGLPANVSEEWINRFRKGTKPEGPAIEEDIIKIKRELATNVIRLREDLAKRIFKKYDKYTTSYGYELHNIEDAVRFNNVHEGLHFGYILALKRAIQ